MRECQYLILEVHDLWSEQLQGPRGYYCDYEPHLVVIPFPKPLHLASPDSYLVYQTYKNSYFNKRIGIKNSFTIHYPITTHYLIFTVESLSQLSPEKSGLGCNPSTPSLNAFLSCGCNPASGSDH